MTYIAALEVQGFGAWRLCARHLLPNISSLIVAQGTILFGFAMVDLAAASPSSASGCADPAGRLGRDGVRGQDQPAPGLPARVTHRGALHRGGRRRGELPGRPARHLLEGRPPMSPLLEVRDLTVRLQMDAGLREVITGTTLSIAEGEAIGLVGESGSGSR